MVEIGVDCSGQVKQFDFPIWVVASRHSKRKQLKYVIYISTGYHASLAGITKNWFEKVSAILFFKACHPLFHLGDVIFIDKDFPGQTEKYFRRYFLRLFGKNYYGKKIAWTRPSIEFIPARYSSAVKEADRKSKKARYGKILINEKDPDITKEISMLE